MAEPTFPALTRTRPETCLSDRALDMMMSGELAADLRANAQQHLPGCAACSARYRELQAGRAAFPLEAPGFAKIAAKIAGGIAAPAPAARARRGWWLFGGGFATLAAAAALALFLRPFDFEDTGVQTKGGERIGFFVLHDGAVREGAPGEIVRAGDRLQVVYTARAPRHLALFSRDARGAATVAFPRQQKETARIEPGTDTPLPYSLELDAAPGIETLYGLFCNQALPLEPLRQRLQERGDGTVWPDGCHVDRVSYKKQ